MSNKLQTPVFRAAFPWVFEPRAAVEGQALKYSMTMIFTLADINKDPVEKRKWEELKAAAKAVAMEKWPKGIPKGLMDPFKDGAEKIDYIGFGPGTIFINASSKQRPGLVDAAVNKITQKEDFYGGCYARATVNPYAWEYMGKRGVSFGLQNIQKVKDGEPFGGRSRAEDDFSAESSSLAEETSNTGLFD